MTVPETTTNCAAPIHGASGRETALRESVPPRSAESNGIPASLETGDIAVPCSIWSVESGDLRIRSDSPVVPGSIVTVRFYSYEFKGEVVHCTRQAESFRSFVRLLERDLSTHRAEPRFPVHSDGLLTVVGAPGPVDEPVKVCDISGSGLGIELAANVAKGTLVMIRLAIGAVFGEVRHCHQISPGWFGAGVGLGEFAPDEEHLHTPGRLTWLKFLFQRETAK